jgi:predicted ArsR family transcriptional regulator
VTPCCRPHASAVPSTVRIWNERAVLSSLHDGRAWRAAQIADAAGLTPASVRDVLRTLVAKGRVRSLDPEQAGAMGRPARTLQHARPDGLTLGIHLDEKFVRMVVGEVFGKARVVREIPIASDDADEAAGAVTDLLSRVDRTRVWMTGCTPCCRSIPARFLR